MVRRTEERSLLMQVHVCALLGARLSQVLTKSRDCGALPVFRDRLLRGRRGAGVTYCRACVGTAGAGCRPLGRCLCGGGRGRRGCQRAPWTGTWAALEAGPCQRGESRWRCEGWRLDTQEAAGTMGRGG